MRTYRVSELPLANWHKIESLDEHGREDWVNTYGKIQILGYHGLLSYKHVHISHAMAVGKKNRARVRVGPRTGNWVRYRRKTLATSCVV